MILHSLVARSLYMTAAGMLLAGCMTSRVEESKNAATGLSAGESVVILATSYHRGKATEEDFVSCVNDAVQSGDGKVRVTPQQEFVDALFPWFEPRTAPQSAEALPELLARPGVAERIEAKGVRYLVWLDGTTEKTSGGGSLSCAVGPGGGGCFGLTWWEDDASYDAAVWDLRRQSDAGSVSADVHGTSMIPALIIPVPLIARTQSAACKDMAQQLRQFIRGPDAGT
ncbi:hypothetical protein GPROT2_01549 [Gammaproteobacteria bacterium]|nr:hypothetical protein [Gammaproteobacteria bacterium]CAG0942024.1 hypothetical protein GPROT2_01549 [Gammaproteobacteria bacterium]